MPSDAPWKEKRERLQNISYEDKENASVQDQNKTAQPAAFKSICNFTVPMKHGPEEPGHLLHFSVWWWGSNLAPADEPKLCQEWTANQDRADDGAQVPSPVLSAAKYRNWEILLDFMVKKLKDPKPSIRFGLLHPLDFWPLPSEEKQVGNEIMSGGTHKIL